MRLEHFFDPLGLSQQFIRVPVVGQQLFHRGGALFADGRDLAKPVADHPDRADGARRTAVDAKHAVFLEGAIGTPWHEMELIGLRVQVDEEIVAVAGVTVPKTEQPLDGPELVKRLFIDELP